MQEEEVKWVHIDNVDFFDKKIKQYHVDTRDFYCSCSLEEIKQEDINKLKKYPNRFFYTDEEIKNIIYRLFNESGGNKEWRFLSLKDHYKGWELKYLRIYRTEFGTIMRGGKIALNKSIILQEPIDTENL